TTSAQRVVVGALADLSERVAETEMRSPTLVVIGDVVRLREELHWYGLPAGDKHPVFEAKL
ncbi:MAG: hypothetical protein GWO24_18635, partial [Akkermansiaceae bacterium]|nr:hypothetical protein [Akkermansiaceae bacterium]